MAYEIFETMNDRGLSLTPTEMLKGYLLSNVRSAEDVVAADSVWRDEIRRLGELDNVADADFFKLAIKPCGHGQADFLTAG